MITSLYSVKTLVDYNQKIKLTQNHEIIVEETKSIFTIPKVIDNTLTISETADIVKPMMINKINGDK